MAVEHYNRLVRILDKKIPVTLELDVKNTFYDSDLNAFTVVGEIPGTDKADELVMLGAHFDSWHTGTGRHRQRRGIGRDDGSDANPEGHRAYACGARCASACGAARNRASSDRART